jgi:hypothetical protein
VPFHGSAEPLLARAVRTRDLSGLSTVQVRPSAGTVTPWRDTLASPRLNAVMLGLVLRRAVLLHAALRCVCDTPSAGSTSATSTRAEQAGSSDEGEAGAVRLWRRGWCCGLLLRSAVLVALGPTQGMRRERNVEGKESIAAPIAAEWSSQSPSSSHPVCVLSRFAIVDR